MSQPDDTLDQRPSPGRFAGIGRFASPKWLAAAALIAGMFVVLFVLPSIAFAAPPGPELADELAQGVHATAQGIDPEAPPATGAAMALRILVIMTALALLPALVLTMTCFTRIIIVFSFLRQALGIQGMPPNQVMMGMGLFLTMFIMAPVGKQIHEHALQPMLAQEIPMEVALERAQEPLAKFMLAHTSDEDLRLFYDVSDEPRPASRADVSFTVLVPAYSLSEVRTAFQMGFLVLVPFMVIDLVVASVLMAMGMMMLPPTLIALPIKVMIFVLADGWGLVVGSLVRSFQ